MEKSKRTRRGHSEDRSHLEGHWMKERLKKVKYMGSIISGNGELKVDVSHSLNEGARIGGGLGCP